METEGSSGMVNTEDLFKRSNFIASLKVPGRKKNIFSFSRKILEEAGKMAVHTD